MRVKLFKLIQILLFELIKLGESLYNIKWSYQKYNLDADLQNKKIINRPQHIWKGSLETGLDPMALQVKLELYVSERWKMNQSLINYCSDALYQGQNISSQLRQDSHPRPSLGSLNVSLTSKLSRNLLFVFTVWLPPSGYAISPERKKGGQDKN